MKNLWKVKKFEFKISIIMSFFSYKTQKNNSLKKIFSDNNGFSLVEFIIVITIIGILIGFASPISNFMVRKVREREGALIIRSYLMASTLFFGENGTNPRDYIDLSKYVSVRACKVLDPKKCKKLKSIKPQSPRKWNSLDGNYIIVMDPDLKLYTKFYAIPHKNSSQNISIFGCVNTKTGKKTVKTHNSNLHLLKFHSFC